MCDGGTLTATQTERHEAKEIVSDKFYTYKKQAIPVQTVRQCERTYSLVNQFPGIEKLNDPYVLCCHVESYVQQFLFFICMFRFFSTHI